jgi:hypothetical protein
VDVVDQPPQDPTQPSPSAPQLPGSGWGSIALPAPQGTVTLHSKFAGTLIVLIGFVLTDIGAHFVVYAARSEPTYAAIGEFVGYVIIAIALVEILSGIGILLSKSWARTIGIGCCFLLGAASLGLALSGGSLPIAWQDAPTWMPAAPNWLIFGPAFVLYAYSHLVLMFRWRRPGPA